MAEHRTLGNAGGAAGVLQHGDVLVGINLLRRISAVVVDQLGEGDVGAVIGHAGDVAAFEQREEQALGERQNLRHGADDQGLDPALLQHGLHFRIEHLEVQRHHDVGVRILDLVQQFLFRIERTVVHHRAAGLEDAVVGNHELRTVRQEQADLDALADAEALEAGRGTVHQMSHFGICVLLAEKVENVVRWKAVHRIVHQSPDRLAGKLLIPLDVFRVFFQPHGVVHRVLPCRQFVCGQCYR